MILVYCFIGKLPEYTIDTIYQARLFYSGLIYFIVSDINSCIAKELENKYNVLLIDYNDVINKEFIDLYNIKNTKFEVVETLGDRKYLFRYAFERFFSLYELMIKYDLSNVLFLELDNLIYDDPCKWENNFIKNNISYMFDNHNRFSSGICFIKNYSTLLNMNNTLLDYINNSNEFMSEMTALYYYFNNNKYDVQILPTIYPIITIPSITWVNYNQFNSIFDAAGMGVYFGGNDPIHTGGVIVKGIINKWSLIDYTKYTYKWEIDENNRNIPYIYNDTSNIWIRINNLHIHSKDLKSHLSI